MAEASMLEEPGAGKPHARIRAGAVGQLAVLPRWRRVAGSRTQSEIGKRQSMSEELLNKVMAWANAEEAVRVIIVEGSRARPNHAID